mmetsp:Transcript_24011/g.36916  ORF Transcript_24011/g.36916 Transcript_24011/m.36916 type:complete len:97 (+) Transcript_24011:4898-5188(+)
MLPLKPHMITNVNIKVDYEQSSKGNKYSRFFSNQNLRASDESKTRHISQSPPNIQSDGDFDRTPIDNDNAKKMLKSMGPGGFKPEFHHVHGSPGSA